MNKNKALIVLTTHSMEEAEALCDQLCIQAAGKWRCLGSPAHLRTKYGAGYEVWLQGVASGGGGNSSGPNAGSGEYHSGELESSDIDNLVEEVSKLGFLCELQKGGASSVSLRFPTVEEPLEIALLLEFFSDRGVGAMVGQTHLEHVFHRFSSSGG